MTYAFRQISVACAFSLIAACSSDDESSSPDAMADGGTGGTMSNDESGDSIVDIAADSEDFAQLVAALQTAGLVDTLAGDGPFTVFAPTDAAFDAFEEANPGLLAALSTDELAAILTYHVVSGEVRSSDLVDGSIAPTVQGSYVNVKLGSGVMVNQATVTTADVFASNGVIHVIDSIIVPPSADIVDTAVAAGSFTRLAGALTSTGLVDVLKGEGPFTVFAPTDAAFEAFEEANPGVLSSLSDEDLSNVLLYHVANGYVGAADLADGMNISTALDGAELVVDLSDGVVVNTSNVTQANVLASNGVIHVIDAILLPSTD